MGVFDTLSPTHWFGRMEDNPFLNIEGGLEELVQLYQDRRFDQLIDRATAILKVNPQNDEARALYEKAVEALNAEPFILEHLKEAERLLAERRHMDAIASATTILDLDQDHRRAKEIIEICQQKVEAEPFVKELVQRGERLFESGEVDKARTEWLKIEEVDPGNAELPTLLARCETVHFTKRYEAGEGEKLERLMAEGEECFVAGRFQDAINIWSRMLVIDETNEAANAAVARARRALEEKQRELDENLHRAQDLHSRGLSQEAIELLDELLAASPNHPDAQRLADQIRYAFQQESLLKRIDDTLSAARKAVTEQNWPVAMEKIQEALSLQPGNSEALAISQAVQSAKKKNQAERHYRDAIEHHRNGNHMLAFNELKKAIDIDPDHIDALALIREVEHALASAPAAEDLALELVEEELVAGAGVTLMSAAAPTPARGIPRAAAPAAQKQFDTRAVAAPGLQAGSRFLVVTGVIFLVAIALSGIFYLNFDRIFSGFDGRLDTPSSGDIATRESLPEPTAAEGYLIQAQGLLDHKEHLDAIYYLQKVPVDSPLAKKASALIAKAQQELLEVPPPAAGTAAAPTAGADLPLGGSADLKRALAEGRSSFSSANFDRAIEALQRAIALDSSVVEAKKFLAKAHYNKGVLAMRELDLTAADTSFRKSLEYEPDDPEILRQLSVIRRYKDKSADHSLQVYLKFQRLRE